MITPRSLRQAIIALLMAPRSLRQPVIIMLIWRRNLRHQINIVIKACFNKERANIETNMIIFLIISKSICYHLKYVAAAPASDKPGR
jgi:hypothetical protein